MSNSLSPTTGFGSIASQGARVARRMLPLWKSWWTTTSSPWKAQAPAGTRPPRPALPARKASRPLPAERQLVRPSRRQVGNVRKRWPAGAGRQSVRNTPAAMLIVAAPSGSAQSCVPGSHRSKRSARRFRPRRGAAPRLRRPECQRVRLALALALREVDLQDRGRTVREIRRRRPDTLPPAYASPTRSDHISAHSRDEPRQALQPLRAARLARHHPSPAGIVTCPGGRGTRAGPHASAEAAAPLRARCAAPSRRGAAPAGRAPRSRSGRRGSRGPPRRRPPPRTPPRCSRRRRRRARRPPAASTTSRVAAARWPT